MHASIFVSENAFNIVAVDGICGCGIKKRFNSDTCHRDREDQPTSGDLTGTATNIAQTPHNVISHLTRTRILIPNSLCLSFLDPSGYNAMIKDNNMLLSSGSARGDPQAQPPVKISQKKRDGYRAGPQVS